MKKTNLRPLKNFEILFFVLIISIIISVQWNENGDLKCTYNVSSFTLNIHYYDEYKNLFGIFYSEKSDRVTE